MGRKLDLSGLTNNEAEHVLQVVQRDMRLRKNEEERLSELKQELDEEGSRCLLLSRQSCFNQRCCIRCCSPFTFLLNPKRQCRDCLFNVCKACRVYNKQDKAWLCSACQKSRLLKTQSLEWFYTNVKRRFKRFGSAKVLKTLYRKHLVEQSALAELTEGSAYEESTCNEGSICGSDSTFYIQSQEHSMAETLTVALRVAEEAIDEAISEAEFDASQEKQNEAYYLRENRGELVDELAKTIVQKIISRRNTLADVNTKYDQDWPLEHNTDHQLQCRRQSTREQACISFKNQPGIWRRHSAFALLDMDSPGLVQQTQQALKKEGAGSALSTWKSVDRLDNPGVSSVLKSPDGNWIALQSAQLSRPSLLTRRKSLVYSVLERESVVVSAYEGMGSDNETKPELDSSWGAVLQEIHRKMTDSNCSLHDTEDRISPHLMNRRGSRDDLFSDSEGNWKLNKPLLGVLKRKVPAEIRRPSSSPRTSIIDVNFNVERARVESSAAAEPAVGKVRRSKKKKESKKEPGASCVLDYNKKDNPSQHTSDAVTSDTLTSGAATPEPFNLLSDVSGHVANQMEQDLTFKLQQFVGRVSDSCTRDEGVYEVRGADDDAQSEERRQRNKDKDGRKEQKKNEEEEEDVDEEEMKDRLYRLVAQSRLTYFSSTDDELDRAGLSEGEWDGERDENMEEQKEEKTEGLTYKLCQLDKEVRATRFSSTEDELDRFGIADEEKKKTGEEEELAVKVCRLANKVNVTQFSSTDEELNGRGEEEEEEATDEVALWKLQVFQVRDLASLLSASQFSSTDDELEKMGENEGQIEHKVNEGGIEISTEMPKVWEGAVGKSHERRESDGDLDVKMFDLREDNKRSEEKVEKAATENVLDHQIKYEVQPEKAKVEEPEETITEEPEGERLVAKVFKETEEKQEMGLERVEEAERKEERTEEVTALYETRDGIENQPEAEWSDKKEAEERREEEKIRESKQSQGKWEMASDSEEEDEEFDRIISSMLLMTVEDMQVEMLPDKGENERMNRETDEGETVDSKTDRTGSGKDRCDITRPDSDVKDGPGENITVRDVSTTRESGDATGRKKNERQEKDTDAQEKPEDITNRETDEVKQTCKRTEVCVENTGGGMTTEREMMEAQGDAAEGECESKDTHERVTETKEKHADDTEQSCTSSFLQEGLLSPEEIQNDSEMELYKAIEFISTLLEQRYSAVSLRNITTEVLKVLNATEDLLQGGDGPRLSTTSLPPDTDPKKLDQQFSRLEENVYVAAGAVYSLEAELSDLEECARGICSSTSDMELSFLEEQVASAAAKVQQSDLQICDISARIAALKSAGLDVNPQSCFPKTRTIPVMPVTLDSSRQLRRRLPAPPLLKEDKET